MAMIRLTEEIQIGPFASLKDKAEAKPGAFADYDCFFAHMVAVTRLKQYEDTGLTPEEIMELCSMHKRAKMAELLRMEENRPLTLEELRGMIGEPVWVQLEGYIVRDENYALVKGFDTENIYLISPDNPDDYGSIDLYGEDWLAYRRKPEE